MAIGSDHFTKRVIALKKTLCFCLCVLLALSFAGCSGKDGVKATVKGNMKTYCEMKDGTWTCDGYAYQYRLEISGRMPNAAKDSTFVYLSNIEEIPFEKAYMAAGLSSNMNDYFAPEEAVLVEME